MQQQGQTNLVRHNEKLKFNSIRKDFRTVNSVISSNNTKFTLHNQITA